MVALPVTAKLVEVPAVNEPLVKVSEPRVALMFEASSLPPVRVRPWSDANPPPDTDKPPLVKVEVAVPV